MEIYEWVVLLTVFGEGTGNNTIIEYAGCLIENTYGYGYLQFFSSEILPKDVMTHSMFYMEFHVRAHHNAHILLAEQNKEERGVEIVLGGGSNTFSQIRQLNSGSKKTLKTVNISGIVTDTEDRGFWINVTSTGDIWIGRHGESDPFLAYAWQSPFPIEYFAFATWTNTKGIWHFACPKNPRPGEYEDEERNPTTAQRLRNDLLNYNNPWHFPEKDGNPNQTVQIQLTATGLHLDVNRGTMEISGLAKVAWKDWKLTWHPQDYDGMETILVSPFMVWKPKIRILNSSTFAKTDLLAEGGYVTVGKGGDVNWTVPFATSTFCIATYRNWPYDKHNCTLVIGFSGEPLAINIEKLVLKRTTSNWYIENDEENGTITYIDQKRDGVIEFHLKRRNPSEIIANFAIPPIISAATLTLLSFWVNPNSFIRLFLCCGSIFILIASHVIFGSNLSNSLTSASAGFNHMTIFCYLPVLFFIGLRYLPDSINLSEFFSNVLNSVVIQFLFCFPEMKPENETKSSSGSEAECRRNAHRLMLIYERLMFFVYLICFAFLTSWLSFFYPKS